MKKTLFTIFCFLLFISPAFSADQANAPVDLNIDPQAIQAYTDKNPFKSKLPEKPKEVKAEYEGEPSELTPNVVHLTPVEPPKPPVMSITGIVWNTDKPQAIINGQVVNPGDTIEGAQIVSIKKSGIDVIFEDVNFTLKP
jgi:hypothetical protein